MHVQIMPSNPFKDIIMKDVVKFFWLRWHRATAMDSHNKINNKPTRFWIEADEWVNAYKSTLSKNKQSEFDKEWNSLEKQLTDYQDGRKGAVNPMSIN
jgi:hypothetical protein